MLPPSSSGYVAGVEVRGGFVPPATTLPYISRVVELSWYALKSPCPGLAVMSCVKVVLGSLSSLGRRTVTPMSRCLYICEACCAYHLSWLSRRSFVLLRFCQLIFGQDGVYGRLAPSFARASAFSLPIIPECPGIHLIAIGVAFLRALNLSQHLVCGI
jgi:hypothetical protein